MTMTSHSTNRLPIRSPLNATYVGSAMKMMSFKRPECRIRSNYQKAKSVRPFKVR
jgi:hypothetical protein